MKSIKAKLKKPASTSPSNKDDWSKVDQRIWHCVAVNQPAKLASKLSKNSNINVNKLCPSVGYSVVHYAAAKGLEDCLNVLLAHKAKINSRDVTGSTPLHASARYGHKGTTTKLLAARSVDVNAVDQNHCTALHFAAFEGHVECLKLIAKDPNCNIHCIDKEGRTALMVAAAMGRLEVCKELISLGVNVNRKDTSSLQHSALTLAAEAGHAEVVRLLCTHGASLLATLTDGKSAVDVARSRNRRSVVDALHIVQLTEAAKKTDEGTLPSNVGSRLLSGASDKSESPSSPDGPSSTLPYMDDNGASNVQRTNADKVKVKPGSPANQEANTTVMSLYNDPKSNSLYDRDVSIYDSKSTLASVSSLDVSVFTDTGKTLYSENPPTPKLRPIEPLKHSMKLAEELSHKEEQIAILESQIRQITISYSREIESLKTSNDKYEISVQGLEKANLSLSQDCCTLQVANKAALEEIAKLQTSENNRLSEAEETCQFLQEKLVKTDDKLRQSTAKLEKLVGKNLEAMSFYTQEQRKNKEIQIGLNQLLLEIGKPNDNGDYEECLRILKHELLQINEKNAKKIEINQERKIETEQLHQKLAQQEDVIEALTLKLDESESTLQKHKIENQKLVLTVRDIKERLQQAELVNTKNLSTTALQKREISYLKDKLSAKTNDYLETKDLEDKLEVALSVSEQFVKEYEADKSVWEQTEERLEREAKEIKKKYNEAIQKTAENEKAISRLRAERNQREAKISKLEKELEKSENKRKEIEVETNRARQQVTETKQKCSKLQEDITGLRKTKKDLSAKLNSVKIYECTEVERKKIDSMKTQLENLCKHIQESEKKYNETISIYRGHLLMAAKGELNPDVMIPLKEILKLREEPHSSNNL